MESILIIQAFLMAKRSPAFASIAAALMYIVFLPQFTQAQQSRSTSPSTSPLQGESPAPPRVSIARPTNRIALIIGDTQSAAALSAIHQLSVEAATSQLQVRMFVKSQLSDADRQYVERCNIVIAYPRFATLVRDLLPNIETAQRNGAIVLGVGPNIEPEFEQRGITRDAEITAYFEAGGVANLVEMLRAVVSRTHSLNWTVKPPHAWPAFGYFDPTSGRAFAEFDEYSQVNSSRIPTSLRNDKDSTVAVYFSKETALGGDTEVLSALESALIHRGIRPIFVYGYPGDEAVPKLLMDSDSSSRVSAVIALTMKIGNVPDKIIPILQRLNVPIINAIALNSQNLAQWKLSATGLDLVERSWQVGLAEFAGSISPTVVATRETVVDSETKQTFVMSLPMIERIERIADRANAWIQLRNSKARDRKVAMIYYNYPPGRESIGASYLNVMPDSIFGILRELHQQGYEISGSPANASDLFDAIHAFGSNPAPNEQAENELERMVQSKRVQLLPIKSYRQWFDKLPIKLRDSIVKQWGQPEESKIMTWQDDLGERYFVLPILKYGNIVMGPQPTRGWQHDMSAVYHDITLPPHHQYLAFYHWLQDIAKVDVMLHVGTHATHEWLPGREVGFDADDTGEVIVGSVPQLYIYIVDDVGEGLQAKRRGLAAMISHQTPALDKASLSIDLREIAALISDRSIAKDKGAATVDSLTRDIATRCQSKGILTDLNIQLSPEALLTDEQVEEIEHHLKKVGERITPFGMHTFGATLSGTAKDSTLQAILSVEADQSEDHRSIRTKELEQAIDQSGKSEIQALLSGLAGQYIAAGPGGDPIRNSSVLPTGKNFYGFDPSRMPSPSTYEAGSSLANKFLADYAASHDGKVPERLVFNLWGSESSRHEGTIEAQIMALMGVRPVWDSRGRVQDVQLIPRAELGRPRVDITIVPSGLYRDLFSKLILLLDKAVDEAKKDSSDDNPILKNIQIATDELIRQGVDPNTAKRMASVRLFSLPSGSYGAGLEHVIQAEESWQDTAEVNAVFMNRMSHMFGQGFWGDRAKESNSGADLSPQLLQSALRGASGVIHSRSSNVYGAIDSDDFYQYLGGTTQAVRAANDGRSVQAYVADLSHPRESESMTLERYMGRELRARYLNPKWIDAMLNEGYAGSRMIRQIVDNLWGWQVTVPESVDNAKWQELYEVYIRDRHDLKIQSRFEQGSNLAAYQALVARMQSVIEKGYWQADLSTRDTLSQLQQELQTAVEAEQTKIVARAANQPAPASISLNDLSRTAASKAVAPHNLTSSPTRSPSVDPSNPPRSTKLQPDQLAKASSPSSEQQLVELVKGFAIETRAASPESSAILSPHSEREWPWLRATTIFVTLMIVVVGWCLEKRFSIST